MEKSASLVSWFREGAAWRARRIATASSDLGYDECPGLEVHCARRLNRRRHEIVDELARHDLRGERANRSSMVDHFDHVHTCLPSEPCRFPRSFRACRAQRALR